MKMPTITSIYIPRIENIFKAEFIANVFNKNGIAQVSMVYIEPMKNTKYNRAYIAVKYWHETEAAYNFIKRLKHPKKEARIVHSDDNWWAADINKHPNKLYTNKRVLTIFDEKSYDTTETYSAAENNTNTYNTDEYVYVNAEKTKLLRNVIAGFKSAQNKSTRDNNADDINSCLDEMYNDREKWFSEYIFDLHM